MSISIHIPPPTIQRLTHVGHSGQVGLTFDQSGFFWVGHEGAFFNPPLTQGSYLAGTVINSVSPNFDTEVNWTITSYASGEPFTGKIDVELGGPTAKDPAGTRYNDPLVPPVEPKLPVV